MILDRLGKELIYFDGGTGTLLQERGLKPGELPETWNLRRPEVIEELHREYLNAGADVITMNTSGSTALNLKEKMGKRRKRLWRRLPAARDGRFRTADTALWLLTWGQLESF